MNSRQAHIPPGMLARIIDEKYTLLAGYRQALDMNVRPRNAQLLRNIIADEDRQVRDFTNLYAHLFGEQPPPSPAPAPFMGSFTEGIRALFSAALQTYTQYCQIFYADPTPEVRAVFGRAFTEENIHTTMLNHILIGELSAYLPERTVTFFPSTIP